MRAQWRIATTLTRCDSELLGETTEIEFALLQTDSPVRIAFHEGEGLLRDVWKRPIFETSSVTCGRPG